MPQLHSEAGKIYPFTLIWIVANFQDFENYLNNYEVGHGIVYIYKSLHKAG